MTSSRILAVTFMMATAALCGMSPARSAQTTLDFESGTLSGVNISGNPPTVQSAIIRNGHYAMRTYLDRYASRVPYRTEVSVNTPDALLNQEYWYSFSIFLPNDYVSDPIWEIVAQWHGRADPGEANTQPPLSIQTANGVWRIVNKWTGERITTSSNVKNRSWNLGSYARGRWTDWVFRIKWSYGSQGILEVWQNGRKVISASGPNTYNDARMPYFKMGLYKGWMSGAAAGVVSRRTLYHDTFKMVGPGGSYSAVAQTSTPTTLAAPSQFTVR